MLRGILRASPPSGTWLPRADVHRVVVCRRNVRTLGDALLLTPLLAELACSFPDASVDIVCGSGPAYDAFVAPLPNFDYVHLAPTHVAGHLLATLRAFPAVRRRHYDLAIDLDPWSQTGRLLTLFADAAYSLGFIGPRKSGTTHGVMVPTGPRHSAKLPVYLVRRALGDGPAACAYPQPSVVLPRTERMRRRATLATVVAKDHRVEGGPRIGVFPDAAAERRIGIDWWRAFIQALQTGARNCHVVEITPPPGRPVLGGRVPFFYSPRSPRGGGRHCEPGRVRQRRLRRATPRLGDRRTDSGAVPRHRSRSLGDVRSTHGSVAGNRCLRADIARRMAAHLQQYESKENQHE